MHASMMRFYMKCRKWMDIQRHIRRFQYDWDILSLSIPHIRQIHKKMLICAKDGKSELLYMFKGYPPTIEGFDLRNVVLYKVMTKLQKQGYRVELSIQQMTETRTRYYSTLIISW